jgi:hypothetical protein
MQYPLAAASIITAAAVARIERHAMVRPPDLKHNDGDQPTETGEADGGARTSARWASFGYADFLTALATSVLPSDQIAPGTLWLAAMTSSNDFSIQLSSFRDHERRQPAWLPAGNRVRIL